MHQNCYALQTFPNLFISHDSTQHRESTKTSKEYFYSMKERQHFIYRSTRVKCLPQLHYGNSQFLSRGPNRILNLLLVVDENGR
jgi:hypothetical protein